MCVAASARAFLAIGGRIMVKPDGKLVSAIDMAQLYERTWPNPEPPQPFERRRQIHKLYDWAEQSNEPEVIGLVRKHGEPVNGWLVWEQAA